MQAGKKNPTNKQKPTKILVDHYLSCQNIGVGENGYILCQHFAGWTLLSPPHIMTEDKKEKKNKCFKLNESSGTAAVFQISSTF